jgi:ferredoxin
MRVWIDQDLCTGDGLCVDHCHDVFTLLEDGIAYVIDGAEVQNDPGGSGSLARVPAKHVESVIKAAEVCPGECIFIEIDPADAERDVVVDVKVAARIGVRDDALDGLIDDEAAA